MSKNIFSKLLVIFIGSLYVLTGCGGGGGGDGSSPPNTVTPSARFAYVANSANSTVSMYAVDSTTGQYHYTGYVNTGTTPLSVTVDPTGQFAYVANSGDGTVSVYSINQNTGRLTAVGTAVAAGTLPLSVTVDPTGQFAYVANYSSNNISAYTIDQVSGALTEITGLVGSPFAAGTKPLSVTVDPTGMFAYVANSGTDNNVSVYTINQITGALTVVGSVAAGTKPLSVTVDPTGMFAYVVNQTDNNVSVYTINQTTGTLTELADSPFNTGSTPASITTIGGMQ